MTINARQFDQIMNKYGFKIRQSGHLHAWLEHEGKVVVRTRRSNKGSGDLPSQHCIQHQLKLSRQELNDAKSCHLDRASPIFRKLSRCK